MNKFCFLVKRMVFMAPIKIFRDFDEILVLPAFDVLFVVALTESYQSNVYFDVESFIKETIYAFS